MSRRYEFDGEVLSNAISATFGRRKTPLPEEVPVALSDEFADSQAKGTPQWKAFTRKNQLAIAESPLRDVLAAIRQFVIPVLDTMRRGEKFAGVWKPGGPWIKKK